MARRHNVISIGCAILLGIVSGAAGDDWPQWRGLARDGVWRETGIIEQFEGPQVPIKWSAEISSGYSGPTVADGRVFVTDRVTEPKQLERVHCFDANTGRKLWTHAYDCPYRNVSYDAGPRAAVIIDQGRAYSFGTMGDLFCLNAADGKVIWHRDLDADYEVEMPIWGLAASPLIEKDLIITQIGGAKGACLIALDKHTGKERWRALDDRVSYSAPIVIDQAGERVLVCWTGDHLAGLDPQSGRVHWKIKFEPTRMIIGIATPVLYEDYLFVSNFFDGSLLVKLNQDRLAVTEMWRRRGPSEQQTDSLQSIISTPYISEDHIYGVDSYGELRCLKLATGDRVWTSLDAVPKARWATIHFVENGEHVWMFNERGELIISRLSPSGFEEISRAKLLEPTTGQLPMRGGVCWSHPAFANRHVYARNDKVLLCASLAKPGSASDTIATTAVRKTEDDQLALEQRFIDTLTGAVFSGHSQMVNFEDGTSKPTLQPPQPEQYTLSSVKKLQGDKWIIQARIQYAGKDITIPVMVRVVWAGDTPVITLDEMTLPFLGTYSARVMIYRDFYSGTWFGDCYGGVMAGQISRPAEGDSKVAPQTHEPPNSDSAGANDM